MNSKEIIPFPYWKDLYVIKNEIHEKMAAGQLVSRKVELAAENILM